MAVRFHYQPSGLVTVSDLQALLTRAEQAFTKRFEGLDPADLQGIELHPVGQLPILPPMEGILLESVAVLGYLPLKCDPWPVFGDILQRGRETIGAVGSLRASIEYAPQETPEPTTAREEVSGFVLHGKPYVGFRPGRGSTVWQGRDSSRKYLTKVIAAARLPVRFTERNGFDYLEHTASGTVWASESRGGDGLDPLAFQCELPGTSMDELLQRMQDLLAQLATEKRYRCFWIASLEQAELQPELVGEQSAYQVIAGYGFPADKYEVSVSFYMHTLEALETIKALCGPKDRSEVRIGHIKLSGGNFIDINVRTTQAGHRLELETRLPVDVGSIGERLGMTFTEV